jgi:MULE transposase domain
MMDHPLVVQDIYNIRKELCWENRKGKQVIEALLKELQKGQYIFHYKTDSINRITHLFFTYPKSVEMLNLYPDLILLDCTYKTNRFKLFLLNIVGSTCLNTTFYIAFCFFKYKDKESYICTLFYIKSLYSNSLLPKTLIMDRDMALLGTSHTVFPEVG